MRPLPNAAPGPQGRIRYHGYFYGSTGYAVEAQTAVRYLHEFGYSLELVPRGRRSDRLRQLDPDTRRLLDSLCVPCSEWPAFEPGSFRRGTPAVSGPPRDSRRVAIHHVPAPLFLFDPGIPANIGRTMIETGRLPAGWAEACRRLDEIWVPSTFNMEVFTAAGLPPSMVRVVPIGVDTDLFRPRERTRLPRGVRARRFRFLSVLTWQERKGWDILVQAYLQEFRADEDVTLVLRARPLSGRTYEVTSTLHEFIRSRLRLSLARIPPIVLLEAHLMPRDLAFLYNSCDAFVLPSRGEGLGRPYLEAMASGLPTIGTNWSGNTDFMTAHNSYLIDIEGLEPVGAGVHPDIRGHYWARPSVSHLRELMRHVYSHPDEARERAAAARADVAARWNARDTCRRLARELDKFLS